MILVFVGTAKAQEKGVDEVVHTPTAQSYKVGGTPIIIPSPTKEMLEVGYDNREKMEILVMATNRLIAMYVLADDLPRLTNDDEDLKMSRYAMVQVMRRGEQHEFTSDEFKAFTDEMSEQFKDIKGFWDPTMKETEEEFNRRMKALDLNELKMDIGKVKNLGPLFTKKNASCFGMIMPYQMADETINIAMSMTVIRIKKRMVFLYLYSEFEDEKTISWLRNNSEHWVDAILEVNKE